MGSAEERTPFPARAILWVLGNEAKAAALMGAALAAALGISMIFAPEEALALAPFVIAFAAAALLVGAPVAIDAVASGPEEAIRSAINATISSTQTFVASSVNSSLLTSSFDSIFPAVRDTLYQVHQTVVIPVANIVLAVFLLVALGKLLSSLGRSEAGVDAWQLAMVFIGYALAKTVIDASWELMVMAFELARQFITAITSSGFSSESFQASGVPENVKNWGVLLFMWIVSMLVWLVAVAVCTLSQIAMVVRSIQIYLYTCLAPIPLSTFASESSRSMATGFLKRYLALLLSGAVMALLFVMMSLTIGSIGMTATTPDSMEGVVKWSCEYIFSLVTFLAFGFGIAKSGSWARDLVGA